MNIPIGIVGLFNLNYNIMGGFLELIGFLIVLAAFVIGTIALYTIHPALGIILGIVATIAIVRLFSSMF